MNATPSILISVHRRHVENMLSGKKNVELRRRALHVDPGTRVWIYCTQPTAQVRVVAIIRHIVTAPPREIWQRYGSMSGLLKPEFDSYFHKSQVGCAIVLSNIQLLRSPLSLEAIRRSAKRFQPPQFFKRLSSDCPEFALFESPSK
jgi:predicted transcriptional regulator